MSTVLPNGQIRFLRDVPIDLNYENSLDFTSITEQKSYFLGLSPVYTMTGATRVRDGVIRVDKVSDELLSANYMCFQNLNFYDKWFYAFITNIEYVNNNMCYVYYVLDDIQTWLFDVSLKECFVEREHTLTDNIFEHLVDEGINVSEYTDSSAESPVYYFNRYCALLFLTVTSSSTEGEYGTPLIGAYQGNLNGLAVLKYDVQDSDGNWLTYDPSHTEIEDMNALERLIFVVDGLISTQQADSIVSLQLVPIDLIENNNKELAKNMPHNFATFSTGDGLNGYVPVNKKLYNSPYCIIEMGITDGQKINLQPEFLKKTGNALQILPNISPTPSFSIVPKNYRGKDYDWDSSLSYSDFAQCSIAVDGYKAWVASGGLVHNTLNVGKYVTNGLTGMASAIGGKNVIGGASATSGTLLNVAQSMYDLNLAKHLPNDMRGTTNTQALTASKLCGFYTRKMTIKSDIAESLDDYFTMFGYKVNKVKTPSRRNRPHYTYLKTKGCKVTGGAPADAIERIQTIYDNGIRFWVSASEVGQYTTLDNSPA